MSVVAQLAAVGTLVLAAWEAASTLRPRRARRAELKASLEVLNLLPGDSASRATFLDSIDTRIADLILNEDHRRRHPFGIAAGLYLCVASPLLASQRILAPWADVLWATATIIGVLSIAESWKRTERDEHGNRIPVERHAADGELR